jgi:aspartate/methionine/tyrosine aminotransferase
MLAANRTSRFTDSVISEMTRVAIQHNAINLAQGFPDFPMPEAMKQAAYAAIRGDVNQYADTSGSPTLRHAIARKYREWYGMEIDGDRHVTVTCGATEAMSSAFMALINPGDEIIVLEPFYESYGPNAMLTGATSVVVPLDRPTWRVNAERIRRAITKRTKAIIVNTPHNPTGRVFTRAELTEIAELCVEHDLWAITDGPYEHMVFAGEHIEMATLPGMADRTITISSLSKTFSITGWRIGYAVAPPAQTEAIKKVHDYLTVGTAAPLQEAALVGYSFGPEYYRDFTAEYRERRDFLSGVLRDAGFTFEVPEGAYYIFADFSKISGDDDLTFARRLATEIGVGVAPGSGFCADPTIARAYVRFAFCKKMETLEAAAERLRALTR